MVFFVKLNKYQWMRAEKTVHRNEESGIKIFDNRSLYIDYRTIVPLLRDGMNVLDVGCGTGAISKDIAKIVGPLGSVIGIDNTEKFIKSGKITYREVDNLELINADIFNFESTQKFDLVISGRVFQWLVNPKKALSKIKSLLVDQGQVSILDYNHEEIEWSPKPPESMKRFYEKFLLWRKEAGLNNRMAEDLPGIFDEVGLYKIETRNSDEHYHIGRNDFYSKVGIWSKVAGSKQMVIEGYIDNDLRLKAIEDYDDWVQNDAISMTMKLTEVRGMMGH